MTRLLKGLDDKFQQKDQELKSILSEGKQNKQTMLNQHSQEMRSFKRQIDEQEKYIQD